jgi:integrase
LVFATDIPRQPEMLPRTLPPDVDAAVMGAVAGLSDTFARVGITILRHTGLRMGELLDLELDCLMNYGPNGTWLRVPLGKLNDERAVPLTTLPSLRSTSGWPVALLSAPCRTRETAGCATSSSLTTLA